MKTRDLVRLSNLVSFLKRWQKPDWQFSIFLCNILAKIGKYTDEIAEKQKILIERESELMIEFCEKDVNGRPIVQEVYNDDGQLTNKIYKGLMKGENPEYDEEIKKLRDEDKRILDEEVDIDLSDIRIKKEKLPYRNEKWTTEMFQVLEPYIEG